MTELPSDTVWLAIGEAIVGRGYHAPSAEDFVALAVRDPHRGWHTIMCHPSEAAELGQAITEMAATAMHLATPTRKETEQ